MRSVVSTSPAMQPEDYERALRVLDRCATVETVEHLQEEFLEALASAYGCVHTAFFRTDAFTRTHADPAPVMTGRIPGIIDEYRERWHTDDVMFTDASMHRIRRAGVCALSQLRPRRLPPQARVYLDRFVFRVGLRSVCALDLDLPGGERGVVGIFGETEDHLGVADLGGLAIVVRHLSAVSGRLPVPDPPPGAGTLPGLTPRLVQIADLVGQGLTNGTIARETGLTLDTVKKYISEVLVRTGCTNRTELALLVTGRPRRGPATSPRTPAPGA
jgi:DNA-binding CsgD family transcriptional regulator